MEHKWNLWTNIKQKFRQWLNHNIYQKFLLLSSTWQFFNIQWPNPREMFWNCLFEAMYSEFYKLTTVKKMDRCSWVGVGKLPAKVHSGILLNKWCLKDTHYTNPENPKRLILRHGQYQIFWENGTGWTFSRRRRMRLVKQAGEGSDWNAPVGSRGLPRPHLAAHYCICSSNWYRITTIWAISEIHIRVSFKLDTCST